LKLLAQLYEETGDLEKAMKTHRKALLKNPKDVGVRVKLVQLLQVQGDLDKAIKEDEALIQAAPQNPDFVFQLAEALIQRGDRKAALEQLSRLEARMGNDQDSLPVLVDFYERIGEKERARHLLERLAGSDLRDPRHLVELGSRYWEAGDKKKAQATWQRIRLVGSDRVQALIALGDVYLDHDLMREALEVYREVMKLAPKELRPIRAYALALERTVTTAPNRESRLRQYEEARRIWEQLLRSFASDKNLAREARQHMVTLWSLSGQLEQHVFPLERQLKANPPGLEAGRLLAEVQMRLQKYADAQATLERVTELAPGDAQSLQRLEQALVQQKKLRGAIEVLKKLLLVEPNLARRYYERMAKYASELYQDDEAIQYAARAVELGPDDAEAHKKLGEMYQQRQQIDQAIAAFRAALSKNDRLFSAYFELAELLLSQGKDEEADKLLRRVVRSAPDEDLVAQAARLSSQINLSRGTLDVLERDLFSVALGNPQKPLYRRLLVEIYGALAFPLVHQAKLSDPKLAEAARAELKKLGERAVKPLLDALGDSRDSQQRVAIELLGHIQNKGAGPALFAFATGPGEQELRVRAMIAVGELRDPALLPKFAGILDAREARLDESDPVIVAAVWSVARMRSPKAARLLKILLSSESPDISALAALGLGLLGDKLAGPRLSSTMRSSDAGPLPRAAAAFALGELGMKSETGMLGELVESRDPTLQVTVLIALSRLGVPAVRHEIADAFMIPEPSVQRAAVSAAMIMATGAYRAPRDPLALSASDTKIDVRALIEELCPVDYTPDERALAFSELSSELSRAAVASVQSSAERASAVMDTLMAGGTRVGFGPLLLDLDRVKPEFADKARRGAEAIAASVVEPVVALMNHPSAEVRTRVVQFLATRSENIAKRALIQALRDPDERVERAAIEGAEHRGGSEAMEAIAGLLKSSGSWPVRLRAASALGNGDAAARPAPVLDALSRAARTDTHALVREAAVIALNRLDRQVALPVLRAMAQSDPEVRLRQLALALSEGAKPPR
jgi:tetratricopeptide (TPR) repeat protein